MKACALGRTFFVKELLKRGANPLDTDKNGENCFDKARKFDRSEILDILNGKNVEYSFEDDIL